MMTINLGPFLIFIKDAGYDAAAEELASLLNDNEINKELLLAAGWGFGLIKGSEVSRDSVNFIIKLLKLAKYSK